ncbi:helix-turn-helix domain-containing protein [Deinococcus antarcticus]|uniref:Helix-turn-helix domain-containing protein n=1 Tax=Deinococcus antarcticus TaxID=1298767 RepID=A0ABV8A4P9_9DEIO
MTLELKQLTGLDDLRLVQDALHQLERGEATVTLPATLTPFLSDLLRHIRQGDALTVVTSGQALSTNQAADLLGVSRPFLIHNLLEAGLIPFHYVGTHRRVLAADVLAYQQEKERQQELLDEITAEAQAMGLY